MGKRLKISVIGLICASLVACAGQKAKSEKQTPGVAGQQTKSKTVGKSGALGAPTIATTSGEQQRLGEEVQIPGTTEIETTKSVSEQRSIPTIEKRSVQADINRMNADDFVALGMDRNSAAKVVQYRLSVGPFQSVDELRKVPGFDVAWFERLRDRLAVS